jgi:Papain family cysteine protease
MNLRKLRLKSCFLCFILLPLSILAQKATGLIEDDEGYANQPLMPQYEGSKAKDLPAKVSLKSYCPAPRNQGDIQSCVGWSIGYGAFSIEKAVKNNSTDTKTITEEAFSALFIYNQIKSTGTCEKALSSMSDAMNFLKKQGNCLAKEFDLDVNDCMKKPNNILLDKAKKNVLKEHVRLFPSDANNATKIEKIKTLLAEKKPVIIGLRINVAFAILKNTKFWYPPKDEIMTLPHAIVIVGYDDASSSFELFNSWGKDWGDNGFIRVKYDDLARNCGYAYVIYLNDDKTILSSVTETKKPTPSVLSEKSKEKPIITTKAVVEKPLEKPLEKALVDLAGQFEINQHVGQSKQGKHLFEPVEVARKDYHYFIQNKTWRVGQLFQLALSSDFSGAYVYVFSLNSKNEIKILYPRNEENGYKDRQETPLIMLDGARLVLPNPNAALRVEHEGTDRICIFFSLKKINNLSTIINSLKNKGDSFDKSVHELLGTAMIPFVDTVFEDKKIAFSTSSRSGGAIVPIIIEYQAQK